MVRATIEVEGANINLSNYFSTLELKQSFDWHHLFEVRILRPVERKMLRQWAEDFVGKRIQIGIDYEKESDLIQNAFKKPDTFEGVITGISQYRTRGGNELAIKGYGPSIYLDGGVNTRSFTNKPLQEIVDEVLEPYIDKIAPGDSPKPDVSPRNFKESIPYLVQYKESNFDFICRIAEQYGEWFYYNGLQVHFGKADTETLELSKDSGLEWFDLVLKSLPLKIKGLGYDYLKNEQMDKSPEVSAQGLGDYAKILVDKSENNLFTNPAVDPILVQNDKKEFERVVQLQQESRLNEMTRLLGGSKNPNLAIGGKIKVIDTFDHNSQREEFGQYIITEITQTISREGGYSNEFEAVPVDLKSPPLNSNVAPPTCEPQWAEVTDVNDDDASLGRVKVQFQWQKEQEGEEKSPWIRVLTPYSGADKGFYLIPEIGDRVWVEFEEDSPEKPIVTGSFYHKDAKPASYDSDNNLKVFQTRRGSQIFISDEEGKETIRIATPDSKNEMSMTISDGKASITVNTQGEMVLSAKETLTINAKKIAVNAENNLSLSGSEISVSGSKKTTIGDKEVTINSSECAINSNGKISIQSPMQNVDIKGMMINLNST